MEFFKQIAHWKAKSWFTTFVIFLLIQAIFLSVFALTWRVYSLTRVNDIINHDTNLAEFVATTTHTTLRELARDTVQLSAAAGQMAAGGAAPETVAEGLASHFLFVGNHDRSHLNLRFISADRQILLNVARSGESVSVSPRETLQHYSDDEFFQRVRSLPAGDYLLSGQEPAPGGEESSFIIRAAAPIHGPGGGIFGVIEIDFEAGRMVDAIAAGLKGTEGFALLLSQTGEVILPREQDWPAGYSRFRQFPAKFPGIWANLTAGKTGNWKTDGDYVVVQPIDLTLKTPPGQAKEAAAPPDSGAAALRWFAVSLFKAPAVPALVGLYPGATGAIAFGYLLLGLIVSMLLNKSLRYRQEAMRKIRELADFHAFVQNTMVDGVIVLDQRGTILSVNSQIEEIFGFSRQELLGKPIMMLAADEIKNACRDMFRDSVKTGTFKLVGKENVAIKGLAKDGRTLDLEAAIDEGRTQGRRVIVACVRDVTQRKAERAKAREMEERFRIIAEYGNDIVWMRDQGGKVVYVSPSVKRHLGYTPREMIGTKSHKLLHKDDYNPVWGNWRKTIFEKKKPFLSQARLRHKNGQYLWFESVSEPIVNDKGEATVAVTASRNIMEQLKADDERTRLGRIIESSLNEIYILDARTLKFEFVNRQGRQNLGYTMKELREMGPPDITHEYKTPALKKLLKPLQTGKKQKVTIETQQVRKDGSVYDAEVNLQYSEAVERPFYLGIVEDITEKKRAKAKAEEAEQRFRMLIEYSNDVIYHRDAKGRVIYVSPSIKQHLGYEPKDLIGKTTWRLIHPDEREQIKRWKEAVLNKTQTFRSRARVRDTKGNYLWFDSVTDPIRDAKGKVAYSVTTSRNVNEQVRAEQERYRLQEIIEESLSEVYVIDPKTYRFRYANQRARSNLGYTLSELQGMTPSDIAPPNPRWTLKELFVPLVEGKKEKIVFEGKNRRKNGSLYDVEITLRRLRTGEGVSIVGVLEDITEKKMAAEQLRQAQKMEVVGQMTGGIAHDFNNLLTTILGSLRLLEQEKRLTSEMKELLALAVKSTKRGAELTHRLLAFSRKQKLEPQLVVLSDLVSDLKTLLTRTVGEAIQVDIHPSRNKLKAFIDPVQFENVILNLAINSRDAMPAGGTLDISLREEDLGPEVALIHGIRPGRYALISVADTGLGMTKEVLRRATEPFFTTKGVGEGSGLGLSMIYGFAKQSDGAMAIESEPGKGTTVKIYLPLPKGSPKKLERKPGRKPGRRAGGKRILLVEDDPQVLEFAKRALTGQQHRIVTGRTGDEAIELITNHRRFDLLITDVVLPGRRTGFDVAKEFRRRFPKARILFCSGSPEKALGNSEDIGLSAEILPKPYELTGFLNKVAQILEPPRR